MTPQISREELQRLAQSIDESHPDYDDIWSAILFGGKDPNRVAQAAKDAFNSGALKTESKPYVSEWLSEWELRDSEQ